MVQQINLGGFSVILQNLRKFSVSWCKSVRIDLHTFMLILDELSKSKRMFSVFLHGQS